MLPRNLRPTRLSRRSEPFDSDDFSRVLYVAHIEAQGHKFFEKVCELDLEGIVAKRKNSLYRPTEKPSRDWIKIKNPNYSQAEGREELFDRTNGIPMKAIS